MPSSAPSLTATRLRLCVLERVLERLLRDAEDLAVARRRPPAARPASTSSISLLPEPAQQLDVLAQRPAEPVLLEVGRPQLEDERAELLERLLRQDLQLARPDRAPRPGRARAPSPAASALEHEAEQLLADGVVEVEREAVSLGDDRELPRLLVQARVRDRDRRMRGQQADQLLVLVA